MRLVFVKADLIGSRIIRWGTGEDVSHVAIISDAFKLVIHSYGYGVQVDALSHVLEKYKIVHSIDVPMSTHNEFLMLEYLKQFDHEAGYDYGALTYFTWRAFLHKVFRVPYPTFNSWEDTDKFLCTEAAYIFLEAYALFLNKTIIIDKNISMLTPYQLYLQLKEAFK